MTDTEAAWLAGFIDGEGSIMVTRSVRKRVLDKYPYFDGVLCASNTSRRLIDHCEAIAGGYTVLVKMNPKNKAWKNAYHWRAKGASVVRILERILPYLVEKREQAELVLEMKRKMRRGSPPGRRGTTLTSEERAEKERIWRAVKQLNQRGIPLIQQRTNVTPGML